MARSSSTRTSRVVEALIVIVFSILVMLSKSPAFETFSNVLILIYFLFVPGYAITLVLPEEYDVLSRFFYSALIGLILVVSLSSLWQAVFHVPANLTLFVPIITILVQGYVFYKRLS